MLEPGEEPDLDHMFVIANPGPMRGVLAGRRPFLNGTTDPAPQELVVGRRHRFRVITISANTFYAVQMRQDSSVFPWRIVARDGADLPPAQVGGITRGSLPEVTSAGTTRDFEVTPTVPGTLTLSIDAFVAGQRQRQPVLVQFRARAP